MPPINPAITVDLEDIEPNHWVAYVQGSYGCFSTGKTRDEAVAGVIKAVNDCSEEMRAWRAKDGVYLNELHFPEDTHVEVAEVFRSYPSPEDPNYLVNAFFKSDIPPLAKDRIQFMLERLDYTRTTLTELVQPLLPDKIYQPVPDQRFGMIAAILKHVAVAEWWYCDRLGLVSDWSALPDDPLKALEVSRANTVLRLPELKGSTLITEKVGERWSPRKLVRRALWHERDHTDHIRKLIEVI